MSNYSEQKIKNILIPASLELNEDGLIKLGQINIAREQLPPAIFQNLQKNGKINIEISLYDRNELGKLILNTLLKH